jgi:hypothetical protein
MNAEVKHMAARQANERVTAACTWCRRYFKPRSDGGRAQRFCRPACRRAFEAASRRFVAEAMAAGTLTVDALRNGLGATRALLPGAMSASAVPQRGRNPEEAIPELPAGSPG